MCADGLMMKVWHGLTTVASLCVKRHLRVLENCGIHSDMQDVWEKVCPRTWCTDRELEEHSASGLLGIDRTHSLISLLA